MRQLGSFYSKFLLRLVRKNTKASSNENFYIYKVAQSNYVDNKYLSNAQNDFFCFLIILFSFELI